MSTEEQVSTSMTKFVIPVVAVIVAIGGYLAFSGEDSEPQPTPIVQETPPQPEVIEPEPVVEPEPEVFEEPAPVEEVVVEPEAPAEPEVVLPLLDESDPDVRKDLLEAVWNQDFAAMLVNEDLVRKTVVFVDNVANSSVERDFTVLKGPAQRFQVIRAETGETIIDPASYKRYDIYVSMLESLNENDLRRLYDKYQPLVQEVYGELGYPDKDFRDTLLKAINNVLDTPEVTGPLELVQPKVMYQFKDESLESLSSVQKQVLRMGPDNAKKLKAILKKFRRSLIAE